jgi:four helix bundle suffix protein
LRTRGLRQWESSSEEFRCAQELGRQHNDSAYWIELVSSRNSEVIANIAIILLHQCDYLIYKFLQSLSKRYEAEGGFREKLYRKRKSILP